MKTNNQVLTVLFVALMAPFAGAGEWTVDEEITPEMELRWAQRNYAEGTNFTARGMFREAEARIGGGIGTVVGGTYGALKESGTI